MSLVQERGGYARALRHQDLRCDALVVTDRRFWRRSTGSEQRIANLLLYLEQRGVFVIAAHVGHVGSVGSEARREQSAIEKFRRDAPRLGILTRPWNARSIWPSQTRPLRRAFVQSAIERWTPPIVLVEFLRLTDLVLPGPDIHPKPSYWIDTHDLMHQRAERFRREGIPLERTLDEEEEARLLGGYDTVLAIQPVEADGFRKLVPEKEVLVVRHGVPMPKDPFPLECTDSGLHSKLPANSPRQPLRPLSPSVGFLGGPGEANRHALDWFVTQVWPTVRAHFDRPPTLSVGGQVCREWTSPDEDIIEVGPVDSAGDFWQHIDIAVNPIRAGSGLKIKNVEALAWARPLLTTSIGAEGLEGAAPDGLRIADDPMTWSKTLIHWLSDRATRHEVGRRGRAYAESHLCPEAAFLDLEQKIAQTLGETGR